MLKKIPYVNGLVWLVILTVLPLPLIQTLGNGLPSIYARESLAIQLGSIAYVWFLVAIYLATRPKWLDRLIGLPSVYMIHGLLSMLAVGLAFLHKEQTSSYGLIKQTGDWAFYLFLGLMAYSLIFMAGWLTSRIKPLLQLKRWLEKMFHHELSVWLHRLNLVAVGLVFIHVQLISYINSIPAYMGWFNAYTAIVTALYLYQKLYNYRLRPTGKLIAKEQLAPNFYQFTIQMRHPKLIHVQPGDYVFINFPKQDHLKELHPFSVINEVGTSGKVVLAIRGDGDFTRQIQELPLDVQVGLTGGYGKFDSLLKDNPQAGLVLIAGGTGIAPMVAIMQANVDRQIDLYYSVHNAAELVYRTEFEQLAKQHPNIEVHLQQGRFDVSEIVERETITGTEKLYLLSGSAAMGYAWRKTILAAGVDPHNVYYEEFSW